MGTTVKTARSGQRVLQDLRERIVQGSYAPGMRLPTRPELQTLYSTTPVTLQRVFNRLMMEGFIVARGWEGTFVTERPPHLNRFALVFPYRDRPDRPWPQFWHALAAEARVRARRDGYELVFSYGNETHQDVEAYQQLVDDVSAHRLAGLIFATPPFYLGGSPVLETPDVPRVAIAPEPRPGRFKAVGMAPDFVSRAIDRLVREDRRRLAIITVPTLRDVWLPAFKGFGIQAPPYWIQTASAEAPDTARSSAHLLMAAPSGQRPDGLIIMDDNLVPQATAGLRDAGVCVPEDVVVVAHANFPHPAASAVPAFRLGYDVNAILDACLASLQAQRVGEATPDEVSVPTVWEDEVSVGLSRCGSCAAAQVP